MQAIKLFFAIVAALLAVDGMRKFASYLADRESPIESVSMGLSLEKTLTEIKRELKIYSQTAGSSLGLDLRDISLELVVQQEVKNNVDLELKVPIFPNGNVNSRVARFTKTGSRLTILLAPPAGSQILSAPQPSVIQFAKLLESIRETLQVSLNNEPVLEAKSIKLELQFVFVTEGSTTTGIRAKVVIVGAGTGWTNSNSNTITLSYVNPKYGEETRIKTDVVPP